MNANDNEAGELTASRVIQALEQSTRALEAATERRSVPGSHFCMVALGMLIFGAVSEPAGWFAWISWWIWMAAGTVTFMVSMQKTWTQ